MKTRPSVREQSNFAFIDTQNVFLEVSKLGWKIDWRRFRVHLTDSYDVQRAYLFIGYLEQQEAMYRALRSYGYEIVFKPVTYRVGGEPKGNVDADLVLQAMIDYPNYEKAVIVTSDGDLHCLVAHLREQGKLRAVVSGNRDRCSARLRRAALGRIDTLEGLRHKLEYKIRLSALTWPTNVYESRILPFPQRPLVIVKGPSGKTLVTLHPTSRVAQPSKTPVG